MPKEAKKRLKGLQPPQTGCSIRGTREIQVTVDADCPLIKIPVGELKKCTTWLIDSGAWGNVMDEVSFKETFAGITLKEMPADLRFKSADGSPLHMLGWFITDFWIGMTPKRDIVYVCKGVMKTRLLGATLLSKFSHWGINNRRGIFEAEGEKIPLIYTTGTPPRTCEVCLKEEVDVPAHTSMFVKAVLPSHYKPAEFIFRPEEKMFQKRELLLPVCLVNSDIFDGAVTVKVTNASSLVKHVGKGTKIGKVVSNLEDYVLVEGLDKSGNINRVDVDKKSVQDMERYLEENHKELHTLYSKSGKVLDLDGRVKLLRLLYQYRDVFSVDDYDLGAATIIKHRIIPKSDKVVYRRQYRHSEEQHKQIDEEVEKLLKSGVVKESMSPYNSPVLMVPKAEPGKWRFCLDCRYINDLTEDQYFPIPLIDEAMDGLAGASIFSTIDMSSGYHQVEMEEESSEMCAFSTRQGHFQYTKLPMGLRGSGMTFQKMMTLLLAGMLHTEVLAYLDDCILFSKSVAQHMDTLEEVLSRLRKAHLKLKPRKCNLFQDEIIYLGHLVNEKGIGPNPEKVKKIKELPEPTDVGEVKRFLGKVNYYRKFVPQMAEIAHPLYELTKIKGKNQFQWEAEHQVAFEQLKAILCSDKVMGYPRFDKEFIVDVDASDYALGVELSQKDENGDERPVFYGSRHLEKAERSYSATARETLAAVFGCEHFKHYLQGKKFILRSDHNPLVWLRSMKDPKRPYNGWIVRLEQFNYEIQYRPGKLHVNADFNSRIRPTEEALGQRSIGVQTGNDCSMQVDAAISQKEVVKDEGIKVEWGPSREGIQDVTPLDVQTRLDYSTQVVAAIDQGVIPDDVLVEQSLSRGGMQSVGKIQLEKGLGITDGKDIPDMFLAKQQSKDEDIGPVIKKMQSPEEKVDFTEKGERLWRVKKNLELKEGLLIRYHRLGPGREPIEQVVLPGTLKNMVLESLHDSILSGHFGVKKTAARVKLRYYWPGYLGDVEEWCRTCLVCQQRKNPRSRNIAPLQSIETGEGPFEQVALDILKLPLTSRKNQYVLVIEDYFSKWVEAFPLKRTVAPSVAQCILNGWISRFGCPFSILSDQGREFESKLFKCLNEMLQVSKLRTTTYHPRTDGMVERSNRTLIDLLSKYAGEEPDWDLKLPLVLFAIRTGEHATTGFSPFLLTYGKEARIPWDILYGTPTNQPLPHEEWVAKRKQDMTRIFRLVREQTQRSQMHQKRFYDKNLKGGFQVFEPGDSVMLCDPARRAKEGKLNSPWAGPYEIVEKLSEALYSVRVKGAVKVFNTERLKKYHPRVDVDQSELASVSLDSDSEDNDELMETDEDQGEDEDAREPNVRPVGEEVQPPLLPEVEQVRVPLMGHRGEKWCNIDGNNVLLGSRRRGRQD